MLEHIHLKSRAMNKRKYLTQSKLNHKVRFNNIKKTSKPLNLNKNKLINKLKQEIHVIPSYQIEKLWKENSPCFRITNLDLFNRPLGAYNKNIRLSKQRN